MATIHYSPKGSMLLKSYTNESASGHREESREYKLFIKDDKTLEMDIIDDYLNIYTQYQSRATKQCYEVSIDKLIQFIEQNGTKIQNGDLIYDFRFGSYCCGILFACIWVDLCVSNAFHTYCVQSDTPKVKVTHEGNGTYTVKNNHYDSYSYDRGELYGKTLLLVPLFVSGMAILGVVIWNLFGISDEAYMSFENILLIAHIIAMTIATLAIIIHVVLLKIHSEPFDGDSIVPIVVYALYVGLGIAFLVWSASLNG